MMRLAVGALITVAACAHAGRSVLVDGSAPREVMASRLAEVTVRDGVSREEAETIAVYFFAYYAAVGCGAPVTIRSEGQYWHVTTVLGYDASPGEDIVVSKTLGSVRWASCEVDAAAMLLPGPLEPACFLELGPGSYDLMRPIWNSER